MPNEVAIDLHRHVYVFAHRSLTPFGVDLAQGRFWLSDRPELNLSHYGAYIQTGSGFDPYAIVLGGRVVDDYSTFLDAYWGLHRWANAIRIEMRHVEVFGHPCSDNCDPLDCRDVSR